MTRLAWFVAFFLCAPLVTAFADSTPPDPIIDMEPDGDAVEFTGVFTFTITAASPCTQIGQFCFVETPTLENFLPNSQDITSVELSFDVNQGTFQVAQNLEPDAFPNAIFTSESTVVPGFSELFTGSTIQPCQTVIIQGVPAQSENDVPPCQDQQTEAFHIGIAEAILGANGSTTVTITANVPEPSSAVLLLGGVAVLWTQRKRLLHHVDHASDNQQVSNSLRT